MPSVGEVVCMYCHRGFPGGTRGLRSHLRQSPTCATAHHASRRRRQLAAMQQDSEGAEAGGQMDDVIMEDGNEREMMPEDPVGLEGFGDPESEAGRKPVNEGEPHGQSTQGSTSHRPDDEQGPFVVPFPTQPAIHGEKQTRWERMQDARLSGRDGRWGGFADQEEWELVRWLMKSGVSQTHIDEYLKLPITRNRMQLSFKNKQKFFEKVDALPTSKLPEFTCDVINIQGTLRDAEGEWCTEAVELWRRDPVECVREILSNPALSESLRYAPEQVWTNKNQEERIYNEAWTGTWWWDAQNKLPVGATVAPVILMSDKTRLSDFGGDKQAYPVYLTLGNVAKSVRREGSKRATVLLGYLPVTKLSCFPKSDRKVQLYNLFHYAMSKITDSLVQAGKDGIKMTCADGNIRHVYPILFSYVGDHPEQCLISCCLQNRCPKCRVHPNQRGEPPGAEGVFRHPRKPDEIKSLLHEHCEGRPSSTFKDDGLHPVYAPFWAELPHSDIFACITPDLLHQVHKGVFKDHLVEWCCKLAGEVEIDSRCRAMPDAPGVRHFNKGISTISQWTGTEAKALESIFVGLLPGTIDDPKVIQAARAFVDFIYYASYTSHTTSTLEYMRASLAAFHEHKDAFITHGIRNDFNFPKFHAPVHYVDAILTHGTLDGYNTELPERLHIDLAKMGYRASSKKDYFIQMVKWLRRQESVHTYTQFLEWVMPEYHAADVAAHIDEQKEPQHPPEEEKLPKPTTQSAPTPTAMHKIAKRCPLPRTPVSTLHEEYGAVDFLPALTAFMREHVRGSKIRPSVIDHFDVFHRFTMQHPPLNGFDTTPVTDTIRATPILPPLREGKEPTPAHFDTVLVDRIGAAEAIGMEGITVARVRAIFKLPPSLAEYPHPLAYVELFTGTQVLASNVRMFQVRRAFRDQRQKAAVIRVDWIRSSCYLYPKFGRTVDPSWTPANVMDKCNDFYINHYRNMYSFQALSEPLPPALASSSSV